MKISFKLNQYLYLISALILLILFVGLSTQYYFTKKIIIQAFYDKAYKESIDIKEDFRLAFDKIQYEFKLQEANNIQKLNFAVSYIHDNKNAKLDILENELNKDVFLGKYEIFIINKNYIVENASYKPDIGLNLSSYKANKTLFDLVFDKKIMIDITPPKIDSASMNLKRYMMKLSHDENKIIQLSYVLNSYEPIKKLYENRKNSVNTLDVYVLTKHMNQKVDFSSASFKKINFIQNWKKSKEFLNELASVLPQYKKEISHITATNVNQKKIILNKELSKIFTKQKKLLSSQNYRSRRSYFYSLSNGLFSDNDETKLIIKTTFDNYILQNELNKSFYIFIGIFFLSFILLWFLYQFVVKNVSFKLIRIIESIHHNQDSNEKNIIVKEINQLQSNYNELHKQLNDEVQKNQLLLEENKQFIADMVHQIRTPLTVIMANASRIEMKAYSDIIPFVTQINSSISMLSNSYEDLSYIISNDTIEYKARTINLSIFLMERIEFFKHILSANMKNLSENIQKDISVFINDIELERLLDNNISNAIKHSIRDAKLSISLEQKSKYDPIILVFKSEGKIIKNPTLLFDKNYRENDAKRSLGLGLHMVKTICDKNNISYEVNSSNTHNNINTFMYTFVK